MEARGLAILSQCVWHFTSAIEGQPWHGTSTELVYHLNFLMGSSWICTLIEVVHQLDLVGDDVEF